LTKDDLVLLIRFATKLFLFLRDYKGRGRAVDDLGPDKTGYVVVEGEYWKAKSREPISAGSRVQVTSAEGKILTVEKKES